jgi:hypothetical protein
VKQPAIYILIDPRTAEVRYVGQTIYTLKNRLWRHLREATTDESRHKDRWLRKLFAAGYKPIIWLLETTPDLNEREQFWIAHYRQAGCKLTNLTDGGMGVSGYKWSEETRSKQQALWTPERREAVRLRMLGTKHDESSKSKISRGNIGKKMPPKTPEVR